jgi:hypothetical protein
MAVSWLQHVPKLSGILINAARVYHEFWSFVCHTGDVRSPFLNPVVDEIQFRMWFIYRFILTASTYKCVETTPMYARYAGGHISEPAQLRQDGQDGQLQNNI